MNLLIKIHQSNKTRPLNENRQRITHLKRKKITLLERLNTPITKTEN